jgi:hypothetical protein
MTYLKIIKLKIKNWRLKARHLFRPIGLRIFFGFVKKHRKRVAILAASFVLILGGTIYLTTRKAGAAWWNDSWMYRKAIPVANTSGSVLTDFQVKVIDNKDLSADITAGKIKSDLSDLRFTDVNGDLLPYWIEDTTASSADAWVKMSSIPTSGATVYLYYGNNSAVSAQDGSKVFEFFDDFNGTLTQTLAELLPLDSSQYERSVDPSEEVNLKSSKSGCMSES